MIEQIKQLVKDEKFCVLATISNSNPYCSLMAYISEEDCKKIYMATLRNTVKYRNLIENPMVSLLIDTRTKAFEDHINEMKALTIIGQFAEVSKRSRRVIGFYLTIIYFAFKDLSKWGNLYRYFQKILSLPFS